MAYPKRMTPREARNFRRWWFATVLVLFLLTLYCDLRYGARPGYRRTMPSRFTCYQPLD